MARSIDTSKKRILEIAQHAQNFGRIIRGSLAEDYSGVGETTRVRMGRTASAPTVQAFIGQGGTLGSPMPEGTPVSIRVQRGRVEVVAFGAGTPLTIRAIVEKTGATDSFASTMSASIVNFTSAQVLQDTHSIFDDTSNLFTVPQDGTYKVWGNVKWAVGGASRQLALYLNGVDRWRQTSGAVFNSAGVMQTGIAIGASIFIEYPFVEGDTLGLYAAQNSGAALDLTDALFGMDLVR